MKVSDRGKTGDDIRAAIHEAIRRLNGTYHYAGGIMVKTETVKPRTYLFTIRMADSRRRGTSVRRWREPFVAEARTRRSVNACWHTHRDVMAALFARNPHAIVTSGLRGDIRYEGRGDFYDTYPTTGWHNIGSLGDPLLAKDACLCELDATDYAPGVMLAIVDGFVTIN